MASTLRIETSGSAAGKAAPGARSWRGFRPHFAVVLPLLAGFVVLLVGFVLVWASYPLLFEYARPFTLADLERRVRWVFLVGGSFTLIALVVSIVVAEWAARPLRALVSGMESARRMAGDRPLAAEAKADGELGPLHLATVEEVASTFSSLMRDSCILRSLEGAVMTLDQSGAVTSLNPVAEAVLGCPAAEAVGRPIRRAVPDEPMNAAFLGSVGQALSGAGRASSAEAVVRTRDGRAVQLGYTITPLRSEAGQKVGIVLTFKDLAERRRAEQLMQRAENLAIIGTMATQIAHEIRNPLAAISGLSDILREATPAGSSHRTCCDNIQESIERINFICQELLTVGNPGPRPLTSVDINHLVHRTKEFARYERENQRVPVREEYAPDLPWVVGDLDRLQQVVLNIVRNAYQAVRENGGEIAIATSCTGANVAIVIRNSGPPIPPEVQSKLFTLFFTTRRRGAGLGLALSQQVVRAHGGQIRVESGPEEGTAFTIELPIAGPAALAAVES